MHPYFLNKSGFTKNMTKLNLGEARNQISDILKIVQIYAVLSQKREVSKCNEQDLARHSRLHVFTSKLSFETVVLRP